jgi:hypothetical protein
MSVDTGKELFRLGFLTAIEIPDRGYVGGLLVTNHFGRPLEFQCTAPLKPNRTQEILYGPTLVPYVLGDLIGRTLIEKVGVKPHIVLTERQELLGLRELVQIPVACVDDLPTSGQATSPTAVSPATSESSEEAAELIPTEPPVVVVDTSTETLVTAIEPINTAAIDQSVLETSILEPALNLSQLDDGLAAADAPEPLAVTQTESAIATANPIVALQDTAAPKRLSSGTRLNTQPGDDSAIQLGRQLLRFHSAHATDRSVASRGAQVVPNDADLREPFERVREALTETARLGGAR